MPQVPKYGMPRVDARPLPDASLTTTHDGGAGARAWGQAMDEVGRAAQRLGTHFADKAMAERDRAFQNSATAGFYDLERYALTSRDRGPKGEGVKGLLHQTGLEPDENLQTVMSDVDLQAGELAKTARTTEQQQWFQAEWARVRAGIERRGLEHASTERTKYRKGVFEAAIAGSRDRVGLHAASGAAGRQVIAEEIDKTIATLRASGPEFGLTGALLEDAIAHAVGNIHIAATQAMLTARHHGDAAQYWAATRESVPDQKQRTDVDETLRGRTTDALAMEAVDKVWAELGPKDDRATLEEDKLEARVRELTRHDSDQYKSALAELGVRMQAHQRAVEQRAKQYIDPLLDAIFKGANTGEVMRMPQYSALEQSERIAIFDRAQRADDARRAEAQALRAAQEHAADRQYTLGQRERTLAEQAKFAEFAAYANPEVLKSQKGQEGYAAMMANVERLRPADALMTALRNSWLAMHPEYRPDETPAAIALPDDITKTVFAELGYPWAQLPQGQWGHSALKQQRLTLYGKVSAAAQVMIDQEQRANNNKPLTLERKKEIVREVLSTTVMVGSTWPFLYDPEQRPALDVDPTSQEARRARVPLARLRKEAPQILAELVYELRTNGLDPMNQPITGTDEEIIGKWQDRIEWAAALTYMKAGSAVVLSTIRTGQREPVLIEGK